MLTLKASWLLVSGSDSVRSAIVVLAGVPSSADTCHRGRLNDGATSFSSPTTTITDPVPAARSQKRVVLNEIHGTSWTTLLC